MPFVKATIGDSRIDFEGSIDFDTTLSGYWRNFAKGVVGDKPPGKNHSISMLWEIGNAGLVEQESLHCNFLNTDCYTARTVPVIFDVSSRQGYATG